MKIDFKGFDSLSAQEQRVKLINTVSAWQEEDKEKRAALCILCNRDSKSKDDLGATSVEFSGNGRFILASLINAMSSCDSLKQVLEVCVNSPYQVLAALSEESKDNPEEE